MPIGDEANRRRQRLDCRDASEGAALLVLLRRLERIVFVPLDEAAADGAAELGARAFLRSADAVYLAAAKRAQGVLITYDQELRQRGAAEISSMTPAEWLEGAGEST